MGQHKRVSLKEADTSKSEKKLGGCQKVNSGGKQTRMGGANREKKEKEPLTYPTRENWGGGGEMVV